MTFYVVLTLAGYLCGSLSSAILVCRVLGHADPREIGSRNPGTTNVLRHFGKGAATATLLGDVAKGVLPVVAARVFEAPPAVLAAVGIAAFAGHLFPVFFAFRGGKGVATLIGVLLGLDPWLCLAFLTAWLVMAVLFRYSSLAALTATALNPLVAFASGAPHAVSLGIALMGVAVFWRHRSNIRDLAAGKENKIGKKPA